MFGIKAAAMFRPLTVGALVAGLVAAPAFAAEPGDPVAKVGDSTVTEADIAFAAQEFAGQLQRVPPDQWKKLLTDVVVDMKVMANAAAAAGVDQEPDFERQLAFLKMKALRNAYLVREVENKVTEADVKAAYDKEFANFEGEDEVSARHILVKTKEEAEAVIKELEGGKDFAELAKEKSTDPSARQNGGDLGYFSKGRMVPEFEKAAFELEVGQLTKEPVQSQFGWHVIKVEDKRKQPAPEFIEVQDQIRQELVRARYAEVMTKLKSETTVEVIGAPAEEKPAEENKDAAPADETKDAAPKAQ